MLFSLWRVEVALLVYRVFGLLWGSGCLFVKAACFVGSCIWNCSWELVFLTFKAGIRESYVR